MFNSRVKWILIAVALVAAGTWYWGFRDRFTTPPVSKFELFDLTGKPISETITAVIGKQLVLYARIQPGTVTESDFEGRKVHPVKDWIVLAEVFPQQSDADKTSTDHFGNFVRYLRTDEPRQEQGELSVRTEFADDLMSGGAVTWPVEMVPGKPPIEGLPTAELYATVVHFPKKPGNYYIRVWVAPTADLPDPKDFLKSRKWGRKVVCFEAKLVVEASAPAATPGK